MITCSLFLSAKRRKFLEFVQSIYLRYENVRFIWTAFISRQLTNDINYHHLLCVSRSSRCNYLKLCVGSRYAFLPDTPCQVSDQQRTIHQGGFDAVIFRQRDIVQCSCCNAITHFSDERTLCLLFGRSISKVKFLAPKTRRCLPNDGFVQQQYQTSASGTDTFDVSPVTLSLNFSNSERSDHSVRFYKIISFPPREVTDDRKRTSPSS